MTFQTDIHALGLPPHRGHLEMGFWALDPPVLLGGVGSGTWGSALSIFQFAVIYTLKGFNIVNETEVDFFLEITCFLYDTTNVDNLIFDSSAFSKPSLYIWNFLVHVLLKL